MTPAAKLRQLDEALQALRRTEDECKTWERNVRYEIRTT